MASLEIAEPAIRRIVRAKLRASLRSDDGREHNQDAIDLLAEIRLKLIRKFDSDSALDACDDLASYAATVAYNTCSDYFRAKYPQRTRLNNALRRLIEKTPQLSLQPWAQGGFVCGYAGWRHPEQFATGGIALDTIPAPPPPLDTDSPAGLLRLVTHALDATNAPVDLDQLLVWIARAAGIQDYQPDALDIDEPDGQRGVLDTTPSSLPGAESKWMATERMRLLWGAIGQLLPWHRTAFLLNLRDGELDAFPYYGIASIDDIGAALELTADQTGRLARALGIPSTLPVNLQFAACWKHLPVEDNLLAEVLQVTRPQVIAYRNKAVERLRRMLKDLR